MTEKEKLLLGEWYNAKYDKSILQERLRAKALSFEFNMSQPGSEEQLLALKKLLGELPEGLTLLAPVYFDSGIYTHFGKDVFINHGCYFMDCNEIFIGNHAFIGPFCGFYTAIHPMDYKNRNEGIERALPIHVGDSCWFGANVSVLPGVTIGSGCVIGAGSVVTQDLPENCMAAGNPAKVKKFIEQ